MTEQPKKSPRISDARVTLASHERNIWFVKPEAGTDPDALINPAYWTHVSRRLRPLDKIEAMAEDGSWYQELIVQYVGENQAKVSRLFKTDLDNAADAEGDSYEVKWSGPVDKHRIIRKADGAVMGKGYATKTEAAAALATLLPKAA